MGLSLNNILNQARNKYGFDPAEFVGRLGSYGQNKPALIPAVKNAEPKRSAEEQFIFDLKAHLIDEARVKAHERGEQFSLEHYRKECELFATTTEEGKAMVRDGKWKPAIYADLSGQNLDGIRLSNPKSVKLSTPNKPGHNLSAATQADYDSFNRDGDCQINSPAVCQFYDEIRLNGTSLRAAFVEPATSFNEEIAKAKNLEHMTFSGMTKDDTFVFASGAYYKDIHLEKVEGGTVVFNGSVDGVHLSGKEANIVVGPNAKVSHIEAAPGFSMLEFKLGKGAIISDSDLRECTMSMTSYFEAGSTIQNVQFGRNVDGMNLEGVTLRNVAFNGVAITTREQLERLGVEVDATTRISASPEFVLQVTAQSALDAGVKNFGWNQEIHPSPASRAAEAPMPVNTVDPIAASAPPPAGLEEDHLISLGRTLQSSMNSIGTTTSPAIAPEPLAQVPVQVTASATPTKTAITFGGDVNLNDVALTTAVASLERTVPLNEQASGANMQRNSQT